MEIMFRMFAGRRNGGGNGSPQTLKDVLLAQEKLAAGAADFDHILEQTEDKEAMSSVQNSTYTHTYFSILNCLNLDFCKC